MPKREIRSLRLAALAALYFTIALNPAFWRFVQAHLTVSGWGSLLFALSLPATLFLVFHCLFCLLVWPYLGKAVLTILLILSAAASHFMFRLNVVIDSEMIRNVFEARPHEVLEMATFGGAAWLALFGLAPAALLLGARVAYRPAWREAGTRLAHVLAAAALLAAIGAVFYKDYAIAARNHKTAGKLLNPFNYLSSAARLVRKIARRDAPFLVIDPDPAHVPFEDPHPTVIVVMVGETARAMNFSLNGYERETNPKLSRRDIVNFPRVSASGTATAFSLPCMFSHLPRARFDLDASYRSENLLDIVKKAGYEVLWLDNDGGSKGVADRVPAVDLMRDGDPKYRNGDTFFDEVLLVELEERLAGIERDTLIVLHMMGSHGPSYHRRYPDAFRVFTPACDTAEIESRPREEIVNTYDNTILYTDHVVSGAIDLLKRFPQYEAGLLFVSDHGESLGENGLYLHGFPYALAPREQIRVPMILWMSETMRREDRIDYEKLREAAPGLELSHDNLFHSLLGLTEIDSELYDPSLDLFGRFRTEELPRRAAPPFSSRPGGGAGDVAAFPGRAPFAKKEPGGRAEP
ncbi:MAG: phosphoethanolamine--lipid A transferase [Planctomycetota bacterium]|nr:phosphoethanolamine--lipid A transferase [Planctomycetota bacterium]